MPGGTSRTASTLGRRPRGRPAAPGCGVSTLLTHLAASNINPLHLVQEPNSVNQGRKLCFLVFEEKLWDWNVGLVGDHTWGSADFERWAYSGNQLCTSSHGRLIPCTFNMEHWKET